jgi:hypothetical protein
MQVLVVLSGTLMLVGAVNTSFVGANGVLNRVAEDGILHDWFRHLHKKYGTTHRIVNIIAVIQVLIIIASGGDIFLLGEAYAFGVLVSMSLMWRPSSSCASSGWRRRGGYSRSISGLATSISRRDCCWCCAYCCP